MALPNLDFSKFESTTNRANELSKQPHWLNSLTGGVLKGLDVGMDMKKQSMAVERHELDKEAEKRKGSLDDLKLKVAEKELEVKSKQLDKADDIANMKMEEARISLDKQKLLFKEANEKVKLIPEMTTGKYEELASLTENLESAILNAPDEEAKSKIINHANKVVAAHPIASKLIGKISSDEDGIEMLNYQAKLFREQAQDMSINSTFFDETTGNLMGYDRNGNPKILRTADQLRKDKFEPTPEPEGSKAVKDNERSVKKALQRIQVETGVEYDLSDYKGDAEKRVTAEVLGLMKEYEKKNMPMPSYDELVKQGFDRAFPPEKFIPDDDGKMIYDPRAVIEKGKYFDGAGNGYAVRILETVGDKVVFFSESDGKTYKIDANKFYSGYKASKE